MQRTVSHCHFRGALKLCVVERENHHPFSSCFSIPTPFTVVDIGEHLYFFNS